MGTVITLSLGNLEVDWGKNFNHTNHSSLFRPKNLQLFNVKYHDEDEEKYVTKKKEVLMASLREILPRLELLGYTLESSEKMYYSPVEMGYLKKNEILPFHQVVNALKKIKIDKLPLSYKDNDYDPGEFGSEEILKQLDLLQRSGDFTKKPNKQDMGNVLEDFHPWAILRLLCENPNNLDTYVIWDFSDHMENGWSEREEIIAPLTKKNKFLIVTEGSSDSFIIKKAFDLLRPEIADFFSFVDMEEGYPFTGVGNLHNFCQGLVKIGVANNILIVYDNDTEGTAKFKETSKLRFPNNMKIIQLPSLDEFSKFETLGPSGSAIVNINGKAVAIECFLDLMWKKNSQPYVRWTAYNQKVNKYQGELVDKVSYTKLFMKLNKEEPKYNFSKLFSLIGKIEKECVLIGEKSLIEE